MGHKPTRPMIMEYFSKHVGEHCFLGDIVKETKLSTKQVQDGINNLIASQRRGEINFPIEIHQRGQIWIYRPNKGKPEATSKNVFEELGVTKGGELIIQDSTGKLYKAEEL